jgi:predicted TPR repeat methyltransferase
MSKPIYIAVDSCRVCGTQLPAAILNLGVTPVGDALSLSPNDTRFQAPLALHQCKPCELLQLGSHLLPEAIFNQDYPYFSSTIESLVERARVLVNRLIDEYRLTEKSTVVEIASNDGYLLQHFKTQGIQVHGVEPSARQANIALEKDISTDCTFFDSGCAEAMVAQSGMVDMIIANNVIAHVPEVEDFLNGVAILLKDNGVAIFEFHHASSMVEKNQFDTLYHQHIFYYSLTSFKRLVARCGLYVTKVDEIVAYGGSLQVHVAKSPAESEVVDRICKTENTVLSEEALAQFANVAREQSEALYAHIVELRKQGKRIVGYGAAAKSSTLLSVAGLGSEHLDYVVDQNQHKQGLFLPGTALKVYAVNELLSDPSDYLLIMAWNYADEIMEQLDWFRRRGGHFIIPSPTLEVF